MADRAISELVAAEQITATDMFVLEQNGTAKKLTGQILLNWLTAAADGHGGIASIAKVSTSGLADTYRITLADTTVFDFVVNNGKGIKSIAKKSTSGLVDTYAITYTDGTSGSFTVTNGEKGDKGDNAYIWVKYASQQPTAASSSFGDVPDDWMGIYVGTSATAPNSYSSYKWYQIKGEKGEKGDPATLVSSSVTYQASDSGTVIPSGSWSTNIPTVSQGKYLWTRTINIFNNGDPVVSYSIGRMGRDGTGSILSVAGVSADDDGNVPLTAVHVGAAPSGYGLGKTAPPTLADANVIVPAQFFRTTSNTDNLASATHGVGINMPYGASEGAQLIVRTTNGAMRLRRTEDGTTWYEEFLNPVMTAGTEYATVERSAGKTVYAKRVSHEFTSEFGDPNGASVIDYTVPHEITNFAKLLRYTAVGGGYAFPYFNNAGGSIFVKSVDATNINIRCNKAAIGVPVTLEFDLYFTKT